jgi:polyisoprenyl-teichoic acid--peptidoglycan teichoic acid transferase
MKINKNTSKLLSFITILGLIGLLFWQVFVFSGLDNIVKMTNNAFDNSNLNISALFTGNVEIKGQKEGRTNILLFGLNEFDGNGKGTVDSNIILSYFHNQNKVTTISFMRDMLVDNGEKLNAIYPQLEESKTQNKEYQDFFTQLTNIPIHYTVKINMSAMEKLVDKIGGVEVDVQNTFRDVNYPKFNDYSYSFCPDRGYSDEYLCPTPIFKKGKQAMNGEKALIYARSRKGQCFEEKDNSWYDLGCVENGDDARGARQQVIIQSIASKLKSDVDSKKIVLDTKYLSGILEVVGDNLSTSFNISEALSLLIKLKNSINPTEIKKITLSYQTTLYKKDQLLLCSPNNIDIILCDGSVFKKDNVGNYALRLRQIIQEPLNEPLFDYNEKTIQDKNYKR